MVFTAGIVAELLVLVMITVVLMVVVVCVLFMRAVAKILMQFLWMWEATMEVTKVALNDGRPSECKEQSQKHSRHAGICEWQKSFISHLGK